MAIAEADAPAIQAQAQLALEWLPGDDLAMRARISNVLGFGQRYAGNALAAETAFVDAARLSEMAGDAITLRTSIGWQAKVLAEQGKLREAAAVYRQVEQLPGVQPGLGEIYIGAGAVLCEWNDLDGARRWIDKGIELAGQGDLHLIVIDGYIWLARIAQARSDPDSALAWIDEAFEQGRKHNQPLRNAILLAWRARLQLMQGDLAAALLWAEASGLAGHDTVLYSREDTYLTLARIVIAQTRQSRRSEPLPGVTQMLERIQQAAASGGRMARVLEVLLLQALAADVQGRFVQVRSFTGRALALAEPEGYLRIWLDEGAGLASVLERQSDWLRSALRWISRDSRSARPAAAARANSPSADDAIDDRASASAPTMRPALGSMIG
jgi:LuxR family maltose regulon positive regulatory protein